jgi:hypothetical protein
MDWAFSSLTEGLEFRIEQSGIPSLGQFSIAQVEPGNPPNFLSTDRIAARTEPMTLRLSSSALQRKIAIRWLYAEWTDEPGNWGISIYVSDAFPIEPMILRLDQKLDTLLERQTTGNNLQLTGTING